MRRHPHFALTCSHKIVGGLSVERTCIILENQQNNFDSFDTKTASCSTYVCVID